MFTFLKYGWLFAEGLNRLFNRILWFGSIIGLVFPFLTLTKDGFKMRVPDNRYCLHLISMFSYMFMGIVLYITMGMKINFWIKVIMIAEVWCFVKFLISGGLKVFKNQTFS